MKHILFLTLLVAITSSCYSQNLNPYEQFGYQTKNEYVMTKKADGIWLNNKDTSAKVKNILINLKTKQVVVIDGSNNTVKAYDISSNTLTRFLSVDPLSTKYPWYTPYQFAGNEAPNAVDLDGLEPAYLKVDGTYTLARDGQLQRPLNSIEAKASSLYFQSKTSSSSGNYSHINPMHDVVATLGELGEAVNTLMGNNPGATINDKIIAGITLGMALPMKGGGIEINNPVPSTLARVVPFTEMTPTTLGRPGTPDVFVTAAGDIKGLNAKQIAQKLTIPESPTGFSVFEFPTPQGISTPINRTNPGFVGFGRTAGGAREFSIPNQPIPANSTFKKVTP